MFASQVVKVSKLTAFLRGPQQLAFCNETSAVHAPALRRSSRPPRLRIVLSDNMPLSLFFEDQLQMLSRFLGQAEQVVRVIQVDPEFRRILSKMLLGLDEQTDFPHLMIACDAVFTEPVQWFRDLQDTLEAQCTAHAAELADAGFSTANIATDPSARGPWPFLLRAEQLADALPEICGALVFVIDPQRLDDTGGFVRSVEFLADNVRSRRLKFVALDERLAPCLAELASARERVGSQIFWCSPQELESRLDAMLAAQPLESSPDCRRIQAMAAAVASANKDHAKAVALQKRLLHETQSGGTPTEQAMAAYGLGNAQLAAGEAEAATETFLQACRLCSEHRLNDLAPMAYTNLGVALHRLGDFDDAFATLRVGSALFRAHGNLPGEAFVCDNLALIYQELDRPDEAARVWHYALGRYEKITNPVMADVREAGRADILAKLERLGRLDSAA
jgi:tetratricopeptide (TPR) repeat protein